MESFNNRIDNGNRLPEKEVFVAGLVEKSRELLGHESGDSFSGRLLRAGTVVATIASADQREGGLISSMDRSPNYSLTEVASELGIDVSGGLSCKQEGLVVTEINGVKIPDSYYTPAEKEQINQARQILNKLNSPKSDETIDDSWTNNTNLDSSES